MSNMTESDRTQIQQVAARCQALGIPPEFAPRLCLGWYDRRQNSAKNRRIKLRKAPVSKIAALEGATIVQIEISQDPQTGMVAQGLGSQAAKQLLVAMPPMDQMMSLSLGEVKFLGAAASVPRC